MGSSFRPQPGRTSTGAIAASRGLDRNFELKSEIHRKLINSLNMERVSSIPKDRLRSEIGRVVERLLEDERVPMTTAEQNKIIEEVLRSEEHTSELQSQFHLVCRLLLEKKNEIPAVT